LPKPAKDAVRADGGETYVWAVRGGLARRVPIVRGHDVEAGVEVKQGLKDGDILVLAPPANLSDGLKVSVAR
jgi:HlyD family secretion protein